MQNPTQAPLLELRKVTFSYEQRAKPVFEQLDFSFPGNRMGLIGDNGSGKTTLLHLLVGLLKPTTGMVYFQGNPIQSDTDLVQLRRSVGMVFQQADDQLFCPTVLEDVAFGPLNLGQTSRQAKATALEVLQLLRMENYIERITHTLSGGEKRMIALATVLAMNPKVLLLDEPTNDLDRTAKNRLLTTLQALEIPMIIISHDWDLLSKLADGYVALENGKLTFSEQMEIHNHKHAHPMGSHTHEHQHC
ncbi:energy-coupling factor ABC transporter ATP-binding protein [Desulfogranum japonicum]|uniref:energy-coupling factor ABC transporter ATP-binding protein n=1 Tax=Desulfogranum japonicum TaxID=231447 RepID=UPI000416922C|nr:ABC transporter ATP-binding protein [Desulfogranum japonicum]